RWEWPTVIAGRPRPRPTCSSPRGCRRCWRPRSVAGCGDGVPLFHKAARPVGHRPQVAAVVASVARHPAVLPDPDTQPRGHVHRDRGGPTSSLVCWPPAAPQPLGACFALVAGGLRRIELWAGNVGPSGQLTMIVYWASVFRRTKLPGALSRGSRV